MNKIMTNFFEITITPAIQNLFLTEIYTRGKIELSDNLFTYLTKDSVLSLYPLNSSEMITPKFQYVEWLTKRLLFKTLEDSKAFFDFDYRYNEFSLLDEKLVQKEEYSILRRVVTRVFYANGKLVLAVDPTTKVYSRLSLAKLLNTKNFSAKEFLVYNKCLVFIEKHDERKWLRGYIRDIFEKEDVKVKVEVPSISSDRTIDVTPNRVIPFLNKASIASIVKTKYPDADFEKELKKFGKLTSEQKLKITLNIVDKYIKPLFPIKVRETVFNLAPSSLEASYFSCTQIPSQSEPEYVITRDNIHQIKSKQRLAGLSKVNITSQIKDHKVVLFATHDTINLLENFVSQLNNGISQNGYSVSLPSQFGIKLIVTDKFVVNDINQYERESDIFVQSLEEKHREALALIYLPLQSDLYYSLKAKLAFHGKVSQVISKKIFDIYSVWNLATNIFAKLGYKPWGISESTNIPNADIVLGFAYSSLKNDGRLRRNIGYINVFDKDGVWQFMQSASSHFDFDKRLRIIPQMIRNAIIGYLARGTSPKIIDVHYSKRFSYQEREKTFEVIKEIIPTIREVNFISLDKTHPLRVFDKANMNFNFARGGILQFNPSEFLLSVAGEVKPNALASRLLKVRVWREPLSGEIEILPIASRILAMTKLNWRSAVRETTEPVTLKYAEEIARLTNHFSLTEWNTVSNQLSRIPWFI